MPSNNEFIRALFGEDWPWVHVTDFTYDPGDIPEGRELICWRGDYYSRYKFHQQSNQYFTISTFYADEKGQARRRKALYRHTHVIVLDDVREKLDIEQVSRLPAPTWILETSPGSEQWGYLLDQPCADRHRIENLLDGLVAGGLAPDGKDPGMKGVTRYVRLPDGFNLKANKMVNGQPFKCRMLSWEPFNRCSLEQLANPLHINLDAQRREQRVDGAAAVEDHPLLDLPDIIHVKDQRSDGRFDITCPWVDEHTKGIDNGAAIFTNADGTIGFKCHHGSCQHRTGKNLLEFMDEQVPGFSNQLKTWQLERSFANLGLPPKPEQPIPQAPATQTPQPPKPPGEPMLAPMLADTPGTAVAPSEPGIAFHVGKLRDLPPFSNEAREMAAKILQVVDSEPAISRLHWHDQIRDIMKWSKPDFKNIIQDLREQWYINKNRQVNFFDEVVFVRELNQFYDRAKRIFYSPEAYQNSYADQDAEARKSALQGGMVTKVDRLDYAPLSPAVFDHRGTVYANTWSENRGLDGVAGDISRYLEHFDVLGWSAHREHLLKWMAFTIRHPDKKINHMIILGSGEGCGKDWLLYPLVQAMGDNHMTINGEDLLSDYNDYAISVKHLHINEAELGDRREAVAVGAKLKPLAAAPPENLRVNQKHVKQIRIRNLLSVSMTTNSQLPVRLNTHSRRIYAVWSDLCIRDAYDQVPPEWQKYWEDRWNWMRNGGAEAVIWYLKNQVDLSDFDHGAAPPVTEFLRQIRDASKSPMQQTIEGFIARKIGCFHADLVSPNDACETLRAGIVTHNDLVYCDHRMFTPIRVGHVMREISGVRRVRARNSYEDMWLWSVRNSAQYAAMGPSDVLRAYENQQKAARAAIPLKVVSV